MHYKPVHAYVVVCLKKNSRSRFLQLVFCGAFCG